jgi:hypothetical protein
MSSGEIIEEMNESAELVTFDKRKLKMAVAALVALLVGSVGASVFSIMRINELNDSLVYEIDMLNYYVSDLESDLRQSKYSLDEVCDVLSDFTNC